MQFLSGLLLLAVLFLVTVLLCVRVFNILSLWRSVSMSREREGSDKWFLKNVPEHALSEASPWKVPGAWPDAEEFRGLTRARRVAYFRLAQDRVTTLRLLGNISDLAISALFGAILALLFSMFSEGSADDSTSRVPAYALMMVLLYGLLFAKGASMRAAHYERLVRIYRRLVR